jgi:hypothetical protein
MYFGPGSKKFFFIYRKYVANIKENLIFLLRCRGPTGAYNFTGHQEIF